MGLKKWVDQSLNSRQDVVMLLTAVHVRQSDDCLMQLRVLSMYAMYFIEWDSPIKKLLFWLVAVMQLADVILIDLDLMDHGLEHQQPYQMNILRDCLKKNGMDQSNLLISQQEKL